MQGMDDSSDLVPGSSSSQSDRVLCFPVTNLSQLIDGTKLSERKRVDGLLWRMMVLHKDMTSNSQGGKSKALGVYLQRITETSSKLQKDEAVVKATITLVNQDNPDKSYLKEFKHTFTTTSTDWGYTSFIKWKDLTNSAKGFVKNDALILRAEIKVLQRTKNDMQSLASSISVLSCPACGEEYQSEGKQQPMSLRCGHTFCLDCLDSKCTSVSDSKVNLVCVVCKQQHTAETRNELWFPNHSVIQMIGNVIPKSKYFCDVHQQNMNYYCFDDHCLVCIGCVYHGQHSEHTCKLVTEAKKEVESGMGITVKKVVSKSAEVSRKLQLLQDEQKSLKLQELGLCRVVEESYKQLEEIIQRQKELQLQELRMHTEESMSSVNSQIRSMEDKSLQVKSTLKDFATWQSLPAKEALQNVSDLKSHLEMTGSMSTELTPNVKNDTKISFVKPHSELFSLIKNQGRLEFSDPQVVSGSNNTSVDSDVVASDVSPEKNGPHSVPHDDRPPSKRKKLS